MLTVKIRTTAFALLASLMLVGATPPDGCGKCKDEGVLLCSKHKKAQGEAERGSVYCSEIADCEKCSGVGWIDCAKCVHADAERRLSEQRDAVGKARRRLAWIEKEAGRPVRVAESEHFVLAWDVESYRAGGKKRKGHELVHFYLDRLEAMFAEYLGVLEASPEDFVGKPAILVWGDLEDHKRVSEALFEIEDDGAVKQMGAKGRVSLLGGKPSYEDDEWLHHGIVHEVTHVLASMQKPVAWVGETQSGWLDAGWAHWFEDHMFGVCENVCYQAHYFREQIDREDWRGYVKKLVTKDDVPDVPTVLAQNTETMPIEFHAVAFSFVDFLLSKGGDRFNTFFKLVRRRTPTRDALFDLYQLSIDEFEQEWRAWVKKTY